MAEFAAISFRVPVKLKRAIQWALDYLRMTQADDSSENITLSSFVTEATLDFLAMVNNGEDVRLPKDFAILKGSKMTTIRVEPEFKALVKREAPRLYQSHGRLLVWASMVKAYQLAKEAKARKRRL